MARWMIVALLVVFSAIPAAALTVDEVIEMTRADLGDDVIINQIRATHSVFYLTVDEIIALDRAGVSDPVLSYMIATAFDNEFAAFEAEEELAFADEEPRSEACTFLHVNLGYNYRPWSDIWWDYWWPPFDYYWYAGTWCSPAWGSRYRPWCYTSYSYYWDWHWHDDWCRPRNHFAWQGDDSDRYVHLGSQRDRVRWKTDRPAPRVTLAGARTRTEVLRDVARGKTKSPLARLEPVPTKGTKHGNLVLAKDRGHGSKTYKVIPQSARKSKTLSTIDGVHTKRGRGAVQSVSSQRKTAKKQSAASAGTRITKVKRSSSHDKARQAIRSDKTRPSHSSGRKSSAIGSAKNKSSNRSSPAKSPSVRSGGQSKKSSPAAKSTRSKSGSSRSSGSKKGRR